MGWPYPRTAGAKAIIRYLSLCSGIEAASVAWHPLGWQPVAFAEIEPFPNAVLAHHYPHVPNLGDMTIIDGSKYRGTVELIVGGTPCQSFSVAGKRCGISDPRGALALAFVRLVRDVSPRWLIWENVPGVFSSGGGADFKAFATALVKCGYHVAWRVLDAQYFGVPQRRRRVFLVGHLGDWRPAAAVLFEPHSLRGNSAARKKKAQNLAGTVDASLGRSRGAGTPPGAVTQALTGRLGNGADDNKAQGGFYIPHDGSPCHDRRPTNVAFAQNQLGEIRTSDIFGTLNTNSNASGRNTPLLQSAMQVRRLTPLECERLQGFPDHYTEIAYKDKPTSDSPRYLALGNSMAVPVMRWIGERLGAVDGKN